MANKKQRKSKKAIFIAATPNVEKDDVQLAWKLLTSPSKRKEAHQFKIRENFEDSFSKYHGVKESFTYNTGRAALYSILKAMEIGKGDEVITQAYTCLAVPTGIIWAGASPIYVDITSDSHNTDASYIKKAITDRTRAVLIQHTFGEIVDIDPIISILDTENRNRPKDKKIYLIEDCAHSLGGIHKGGKKVGEKGDAAFFSFGQDKVISCTQGGLALSKDSNVTKALKASHSKLPPQPKFTTLRAIIHPILWKIIMPIYYIPPGFGSYTLGRGLIMLFRALGLLQHQADPNKTDLNYPEVYLLSTSQSEILQNQFRKMKGYVKHRQTIAAAYNKKLPQRNQIQSKNHTYLRFPLQLHNPQRLAAHLKKQKVIPGNWYSNPIHPEGTNLLELGYMKHSCPHAERAAHESINLPTCINVGVEDAHRIADLCAEFFSTSTYY